MSKSRVVTGLALGMSLAFTGTALADTQLGGELKLAVKHESWTGSGLGWDTQSLTLKARPTDSDAWSAEGTLNFDYDTSLSQWQASLGKYRLTFKDPLIYAEAVGYGAELSTDWSDPMGFVKSTKKAGNNDSDPFKGRIGLTAAPFVLDVELNKAFARYETKFGDLTAGLAAKGAFSTPIYTAVAYGKQTLGSVGLEASLGVTGGRNIQGDNVGFGGKVTVPVGGNFTLEGSAWNKGANFAGETDDDVSTVAGADGKHYASVAGTYLQGVVKANVKVEQATTRQNSGDEVTNTLSGYVIYSADPAKNQGWDDLFADDKYYLNVAPAVKVDASQAVTDGNPSNTHPGVTVNLNATTPVLPGTLWVRGTLSLTSDEDNPAYSVTRLNGTSYPAGNPTSAVTTKLWGYAKLLPQWALEPRWESLSLRGNGSDSTVNKTGLVSTYTVGTGGEIKVEYWTESASGVVGNQVFNKALASYRVTF